jgi:FAD binding domain/Berberine and berberine like
MPDTSAVRNFKRSFGGRVILPGEPEFDAARRVHNEAIIRRPALIAVCADADDVCHAVEFARENRLLAAVRSGGHSQLGHSVCDDGIVIDLSGLKQVDINLGHAVARAQTGLRAGELDAITQAFGLATTLGQCPSVGIGGLTTGGGFGWLTARHGLSCDNVVSAQVVTADGRILIATQNDNQDLFWAIRGGGGNFGIAVEFEYRLHPVTQVVGGMLSYPVSEFRAGFVFLREFLRSVPDELGVGFGIRPVDGNAVFAIALCWCGNESDAETVLAPLRSFATPSGGSIGPLPYLRMQSVTGESPTGRSLYNRGGFMRELSDEAVDIIEQRIARDASPERLLWMDYYHGAMCRVAQSATAFSVRESGYSFLIQSEWSAPQQAPAHIAWVDETVAALVPFSTETVYVANLGEEGSDRVRRCYGPNYARLAEIKRKYDPDNFFRLNQNILPAAR